jgi:nitrogenase-stabilizing/protective protein
MNEIRDDLDFDELSSAEEFLDYFGIAYDPRVVHVNRLHILQRFHDYLAQVAASLPSDEAALHAVRARLLEHAYRDFVESDALTEGVFQVFHMNERRPFFIPVEQVLGQS